MKFILGTKDRMTQVFDKNGVVHPATVLRVSPLTVTQVKTSEKDGYEALQVAGGSKKAANISKALRGHFGEGTYRFVKEYRGKDEKATLEKGATVSAGIFKEGDVVTVSAISKGKGFQGVVKRHGFGGTMATHGQKHALREPGSIGGGGRAGGRVIKGMRMAGRMGGERVTVKNLVILQVNEAENILLVEGAVPGRNGALVEVRAA